MRVLLLLLISVQIHAEVAVKAFTNGEKVDAGIELRLPSSPFTYGVLGLDLDDGLPVVNYGVLKRFSSFDVTLFTGMGFRRRTTVQQASVTSAAVSAKGCEKGKGKGVKKKCKDQDNNNNNNNNNGSNGGTSSNGSSPSSLVTEDSEVFQEVGVRVTPNLSIKGLRPSIELLVATPNMGINIDTSVQIGLIYRF